MTDAPLVEQVASLNLHPDDVLVECIGGAHDRARFWSRRPPRTFRVVPGGDVYHQRDRGVWVAEGFAWTPTAPSDDQMRLA
ncbi:MAG: hypothetical protein AB7O78_01550 [Thermoleophilia bacterium]